MVGSKYQLPVDNPVEGDGRFRASEAIVGGQLVSRILPSLPAGSVVSTPRHQVDVVVTEHGVAELMGRSIRERAMALASIGHPEVRDDLLAMAATWPRD